ncbi:MAG: OpgC domain-containing protein [Terracidiphilus sp.]
MSFPRLERRPELDALRGLFLVWMTCVHMPTRFSDVVNSPMGYFSSASGFVFVSALLVGRLYIHDAMRDPPGVHARLWKRSLKVYWYHLLTLLLAFTVVAAYAVHTHKAALSDELDFYLAHPLVAIIGSVFLLYCPPLLDILPMYVIFLFMTPMLLWAAARWRWQTVLSVSAGVWVLAQFGLRDIVHNALVAVTHLKIPMQETGSFNLFGWQALWIVGLWLGARSATVTVTGPLFKTPRWLVWCSVGVCFFFVGVRFNLWGPDLSQPALGMLLDKWRIGPLYALNSIAFGVLCYSMRKPLTRIISIEPFLTLGKASLRVFCAQLVFVFVALGLLYRDVGQDISGPPPTLHDATAAIMFAVTFPVLMLVAWQQVRSKRREKRQELERRQAEAAPRPAEKDAAAEQLAGLDKLECIRQEDSAA